MKVIQQLIAYLNHRRLLTAKNMEVIRTLGFIDIDEFDYEETIEEKQALEALELLEQLEQHGDLLCRKNRTVSAMRLARTSLASQIRRKRKIILLDDLRERVVQARPMWEPGLSALARFARRFDATATLETAPSVVCAVASQRIEQELIKAIFEHNPSFYGIWEFLAINMWAIAQNLGVIGRYYRGILSNNEVRGLERYSWILQPPEIAWAYSVVKAQRTVLTAHGRLLQNPYLFEQALARTPHWLGYWSAVIVYSASRRFGPGTPLGREEQSPQCFIDISKEYTELAWACALGIDRSNVLRLIELWKFEDIQKTIDIYSKSPHVTISEIILPRLACPSGWNIGQQLPFDEVRNFYYEIHSDGTVTDPYTGLMWKRCAEGMIFDRNKCINSPGDTYPLYSITWTKAMPNGQQKSWPVFAGYTDWRLPTIEEFSTIVSINRKDNYTAIPIEELIDIWVFPSDHRSSNGYWTATYNGIDQAIRVSFCSGLWYRSINESYNIHLVRDGWHI